MIDIVIKTVPHGKQRYDTVGDWYYEDEEWAVRVTELGDWRMEFAIAIHELVEAALCRVSGISQQVVDEYDFGSDSPEPGDEPTAPYLMQHSVATGIERIVLSLLGVPWKMYEERCQNPGSISSVKPETAQDSQSA